MIAPPPMPNRPARTPVTTPPAMIAAASSTSSDHGMLLSTSGRNMRGLGACVDHEIDRLAQHLRVRPRLDRMRRNVTAEGTRARHAVEQPEHMTRHGVQARALRELSVDVRDGSRAGL